MMLAPGVSTVPRSVLLTPGRRGALAAPPSESIQCSGAQQLGATSAVQTFTDGSAPSSAYGAADCSWTITAPAGERVQLSFLRFQLRPSSWWSTCPTDWLDIFDGPDASATSLGRYCGSSIFSMVQSTGRTIYIVFRAAAGGTHTGFEARYIVGELGRYTGSSDGVTSARLVRQSHSHLDRRFVGSPSFGPMLRRSANASDTQQPGIHRRKR